MFRRISSPRGTSMRLRHMIALGLIATGGCAANCQTCRAVVPTAQSEAQPTPQAQTEPPDDDRAPLPPLPPRAPAPAPQRDVEPEPELPPLPVPTPPRTQGSGRVRKTTTREVEGAAVVVEQHAPGVIVIGSTGIPVAPVPTAMVAPVQAPAPAAAPIVAQAPIIPIPIPDSLIVAAGRRLAGAAYYAVTGNCPPPRSPRFMAVAPVPTQTVTTQLQYVAVPTQVQAVAPAPVQYVAMPAPAPALAPVAATPQAPRKGWFGR